jgi:hypothetical protein
MISSVVLVILNSTQITQITLKYLDVSSRNTSDS